MHVVLILCYLSFPQRSIFYIYIVLVWGEINKAVVLKKPHTYLISLPLLQFGVLVCITGRIPSDVVMRSKESASLLKEPCGAQHWKESGGVG